MELKKASGEWYGWWELTSPTPKVADAVRNALPTQYRTWHNSKWYIHERVVESVRSMIANTSNKVTVDDPWALLYLRQGAPQAIIKAVWRELAKELHPDRGGDEEQFKKVKAAYERLTKV